MKPPTELYLYSIVLVAAVGGFLFGYDLSLISGAILTLNKVFHLNDFMYGAMMGSAVLGCPFGLLLGVWLTDAAGRKRSLILAAMLFMVSAFGCAAAGEITQLFGWRFVGGMGVGLATAVSPMYIAEIAPARLRGPLVVVNQLAIVIGLSLSVFVAYWLSFGDHWRWLFATQALPVLCLMIGLAFVPESPRWLAIVGRLDESLAILTQINGRSQAQRELREIRGGVGRGDRQSQRTAASGSSLGAGDRNRADGDIANQRGQHDLVLYPHAFR